MLVSLEAKKDTINVSELLKESDLQNCTEEITDACFISYVVNTCGWETKGQGNICCITVLFKESYRTLENIFIDNAGSSSLAPNDVEHRLFVWW